jgi:hypothetical protein
MRVRALVAGLALAFAGLAAATHLASEAPAPDLKPGGFAWYAPAVPAGPLLLVVSLPEQRAYLYRNGVRIAVSTVSTGRPGFETPPGVYTVLQKHEEHYSNLYDDAPMPFMQRLTWTGVALHAGRVPGYPASHGCVRLPLEFAKKLFGVTALGMTVVVAAEHSAPALAHPGWLAPPVAAVAPADGEGAPLPPAPAPTDAAFEWHPERSPTGPLTLLLSTADRRVRVLRNGIEIGNAPLALSGPTPAGTVVLQLQAGARAEPSRFVPGRPRLNWIRVQLDPPVASDAVAPEDALYAGVDVAPAFARLVYEALVPGTTIVMTDQPATGDGEAGAILQADSPP